MSKINIEVGYQAGGDLFTNWTEQAGPHVYWVFPVEVDGPVLAVEQIAEAVFEADNSPYQVTGLAAQVRAAMTEAYSRTERRHHSLSVGDRVRVGEVELAVARFGFRRVAADEVQEIERVEFSTEESGAGA